MVRGEGAGGQILMRGGANGTRGGRGFFCLKGSEWRCPRQGQAIAIILFYFI